MDGFKVVGAAVALPTVGGGIQYLYRTHAVLPREGFTEAGLEHAKSVGLVELVEVADPVDEEAEKAAADKAAAKAAEAERVAAEKKAADEKAAADKAAKK